MELHGQTPRLADARLVIGGQRNLDVMGDVAETATKRLDVDLFAGSHQPTLERLAAPRPDVKTLFLADPEVKKSIRKFIEESGARFVKSGDAPVKNHAKSVVADRTRAIVTTAALAPRTPQRFEVGATFGGDAAKALSKLTQATAKGDTAKVQVAAANARAHGIVVNDAQHGVWHLTEEVRGLVQHAERRLIVATKRLEEPGIIAMIDDARRRGVHVTIANTRSAVQPLHANVVIADDAAYIGSGHLTKRVLTGGGSNGRISRELGIMLEQPALVDDLARSLADNKLIGQLGPDGIPVKPFPKGKVALAGAGIAAISGAAFLALRGRGGDS